MKIYDDTIVYVLAPAYGYTGGNRVVTSNGEPTAFTWM